MTTFQIIIIVIGSLITLVFIVAFILPSTRTIFRTIEINSSPEHVYSLVTDFHNYKKWNPWSEKEPDAKGSMSGTPARVGHKWMWEGKIIGSGYLEIKELVQNKYVLSDLIFTTPRKMRSEDIWEFEKIDETSSRVTWGHRAFLGYPLGRFFGTMLEKMLGPEFEKGLENLKRLSESSRKNG